MRLINSGADLVEALDAVTQGVVDAVGFEVAAIRWLTGGHDLEVVSVAGNDDARDSLLGTRVPMSEIEVELEASESWGSLLFLPAGRLAGADDGWVPDRPAGVSAGSWQPEDTLRAPLRSPEGELLGILAVDLPRDGLRPNRATCELLEMYADLAGLALGAARRAQALERRVRLDADTQHAIATGVGFLGLQDLLDASARRTADALGAEFLWMRVLGSAEVGQQGAVAVVGTLETPPAPQAVVRQARDDAQEAWRRGHAVLATYRDGTWERTSSDWTGRGARVPVADGRAGWVRGAPAAVDQLAGARGAMSFLEPQGVQQVLLCPIGSGEECLGYFVTGRTDGETWAGEEIEAALRIARHLGQSVVSARLAVRERDLIARLESLDRYRHDLVSTVSHELRTPLASVMGYLELIEDATPQEHQQHVYREVVQRNLRRMLTLTDELLLLKRLGAGGPGEADDLDEPGLDVDLVDVVRGVVGSLAQRAGAAQVRLDVEPAPQQPLVVRGRPDELERVVLNLVANAIKYTPAGGRVAVGLVRDERVVDVVVSDTGLGISRDDQSRLFAEFFRSTNPAALALPGTGLGLSIVRAIVQRHGGSIQVVSEPGEGSTFTVRLPVGRTDRMD
ncbi:GAF domain-containing sensor histidine kinase [Nocardioides sp. C4-1]|uniref:GAF domain-containing sensor histidine kinase n=1 Tax=Nocardioides sp. C4-1 TaxID=3151851 RepID=UPI003265B2FD